ncbi:MAG: hypothetical protein RL308_90 [Bacteroidota bacterium]|jgi:hypothetical protein
MRKDELDEEIAALKKTIELFKCDMISRNEETEGDIIALKAYNRELEKLIEKRNLR